MADPTSLLRTFEPPEKVMWPDSEIGLRLASATPDEFVGLLMSPTCLSETGEPNPDCYTVDFKPTAPDTADYATSILPPLFGNEQKTAELKKAFEDLLYCCRWVIWSTGKNFGEKEACFLRSEMAGKIKAIAETFKSAGVNGAITPRLNSIAAWVEGRVLVQQEDILNQLMSIVTGYAIFLQAHYGIEVEVPGSKSVEETKPEEIKPEVPKPEIPKSALPEIPKPEIPPYIPKPEKPHGPPPVKPNEAKIEEDADEIPKIQQIKKDMERIVKVTGGMIQYPQKDEDITDFILPRLAVDKQRKHYQIEFLIDVSGSMSDNIEYIKKRIDAIMAQAKKQLKPGGQVSFGVRYYVDGYHEIPVPLDSFPTLEKRSTDNNYKPNEEVAEARGGLQAAIDYNQKNAGAVEYNWDESALALTQEPWAPLDANTGKVLFLLTDETGDIGEKKFTAKKVAALAKEKGVRFEILWMPDTFWMLDTAQAPNTTQNGETPKKQDKEMLYKKAAYILSYPNTKTWKTYYGVEEKIEAARALGNSLSPRAIPFLANAADPNKEPDAKVRKAAFNSLKMIGDPAILPIVKRSLNDGKELNWVIHAAVDALEYIEDSEASDLLVIAASRTESDTESYSYKLEAVRQLVKRKDPRVVDFAKPFLTLSLWNSRKKSYESEILIGVSQIKSPKAVDLIMEACNGPGSSPALFQKAIWLLANMKDPRITPYLQELYRKHAPPKGGVANWYAWTISEAIAVRRTPEEWKRLHGLKYLNSIGIATKGLNTLAIIEKLAEISDPRNEKYSYDIKGVAAQRLLAIDDNRTVPYAINLIKLWLPYENKIERPHLFDDSFYDAPMRFYLFILLRFKTPGSIPVLGEVLLDSFTQGFPNGKFGRSDSMVLYAFETFNDANALPYLYKCEDRIRSLRSSGYVPDPEHIPENDYDALDRVVQIRKKLVTKDAIPVLISLIDPKKKENDSVVRLCALEDLGSLKNPDTYGYIAESLDPNYEPDPKVRIAAVKALPADDPLIKQYLERSLDPGFELDADVRAAVEAKLVAKQ